VDDELLSIARTSIGADVGLNPAQSRRLVGSTAADLRSDAKAMAKELGLVVDADPPRDPGGRFAKSGGIYDKGSANADVNARIRAAAGRTT
jgi:hypothetical protein